MPEISPASGGPLLGALVAPVASLIGSRRGAPPYSRERSRNGARTMHAADKASATQQCRICWVFVMVHNSLPTILPTISVPLLFLDVGDSRLACGQQQRAQLIALLMGERRDVELMLDLDAARVLDAIVRKLLPPSAVSPIATPPTPAGGKRALSRQPTQRAPWRRV